MPKKHGESNEKKMKSESSILLQTNLYHPKIVPSANYSSVFTPDSDFMGKYAKYTKYKKSPQTISKPLERPPQPLEVISLCISVSIGHIFHLY